MFWAMKCLLAADCPGVIAGPADLPAGRGLSRSVEVAKATLGQSEATIVASEALLRQRQSEERRRRTLKQRFAISGEEWEKSNTEVAVAQAELDLQRTRVEAPVTGYVTNLLTRQGDYAVAGGALLALVDSDSFYVSGYVEETKLPRIEEGDRVRIELTSGDTFGGTVQTQLHLGQTGTAGAGADTDRPRLRGHKPTACRDHRYRQSPYQIRPWALGRNNWLFAGSLHRGNRAAASA